jgi:uracil phosphoribosyltransferase
MVTNLSDAPSLVSLWVREIRDEEVQKDSMRFRRNLERIGEVIGYEISKTLDYELVDVATPMGIAACPSLKMQPVVATIMRAGLPLYQGILNVFDKADSAFIGAYRKHRRDESFEIDQQYITSPELSGRCLIVADPMLATGASLCKALDALTDYDRPSAIHIVTSIACTVGVEMVQRHYPDAHIWAAAIDEELTARGYIVPGLGDAGDLAYGKKRQS